MGCIVSKKIFFFKYIYKAPKHIAPCAHCAYSVHAIILPVISSPHRSLIYIVTLTDSPLTRVGRIGVTSRQSTCVSRTDSFTCRSNGAVDGGNTSRRPNRATDGTPEYSTDKCWNRGIIAWLRVCVRL